MGSDNQTGCDRLNWAGNGTKDGGGPVGHQSRLGAGEGANSVDETGSDVGWTKADSKAATGVGGSSGRADQGEESWSVGGRADQGEESWSVLLAHI